MEKSNGHIAERVRSNVAGRIKTHITITYGRICCLGASVAVILRGGGSGPCHLHEAALVP